MLAHKTITDGVECSNSNEFHVEYAVYAVSKFDGTNDNRAEWAKKHTSLSRHKALARAKVLHRSHDYSRIEIKKMVCNNHRIYSVQGNYKTYEHRSARYLMWQRVAFGAVALVAAAAVTCWYCA